MNKKVAILGGGTGLSSLLKGIKMYPIDISAIVSVCDDGSSTGRLREEFKIPAVGDIRKVITSLAETEPLVEELFNYRFNTTSDLNGHVVGNLILTAIANISGNMSDGITALSKVFNLKGKVIPLTEDNVTLMGHMKDGSIIEGEHNITLSKSEIKHIFYKEKPTVTEAALTAIREADTIILSMGSLYTSIIPNLLCKNIIKEIDKSSAKIMYICNIMTQPGETDNFTVSDHIQTINKYLGKRKIDVVIANDGKISKSLIEKYASLEQKSPVILDIKKIEKMKAKLISDDLVCVETGMIRHDPLKLSYHIYSTLIRG